MNVRTFLTQCLKEKGYDGLYNDYFDCSCSVKEGLIPCDFEISLCDIANSPEEIYAEGKDET